MWSVLPNPWSEEKLQTNLTDSRVRQASKPDGVLKAELTVCAVNFYGLNWK